ncbi:hypothetical protein [Clostridium tarantellae]|uniref:Co-chaperone DjlA N-terminal domain-containing protein n=1 Tax=Clostridium tarantellae TaxID=39493 RepID=A0A6I1MNB4_9CLOT|nr:hypothetical protein [Clostridium tarantellae]MPQ43742.1 hypothetical protein [Clostridium tarantellae]
MFLKELNIEQSTAFLSLLSIFAKVDNVLEKTEEQLINSVFHKLDLSKEEFKPLTYTEAIEAIKKSSQRIINIVYFELIDAALVDENYQIQEVHFIEKLSNDLNISRAKRLEIANYFYNIDKKLGEEELKKEVEKILN